MKSTGKKKSSSEALADIIGSVREDFFAFGSYLPLATRLVQEGRKLRGRGLTSALATALGVHTTFISQVMNGRASFSADQALEFCSFFEMNPSETEYFMDLLSLGRAATPRARRYYELRLQRMRNVQADLKSRWSERNQSMGAGEAVYFGSWLTQVVHAALQIYRLSSAVALAAFLGIRLSEVLFSLETLRELGLATESNGKWGTTTHFLHLSKDSPVIRSFHMQWRQRASQEFLSSHKPIGFHYSGALTFSLTAEPEIRRILIRALDSIMIAVKPSTAENVFGLGIDLFSLRSPGADVGSAPP